MWNKTQFQNIRVLLDNWFQVGADGKFHTVERIPSSALWVLLIHALGSYICYISGMLFVIWCIQICLQGTPTFPFSARLPFAHKLHMSPVGNICNFFRKINVSKFDSKTGYFLGISQLFLSHSRQIRGHYIKLTPRALLFHIASMNSYSTIRWLHLLG